MPSGKTHDQITWFSAPLLALLVWLLGRRLDICLALTASYVFAGLMFSGDLDLKSVQYKRWGWLRWIWIPYQKCVPHRSPFSHGPVLGTLTRLLYLSAWILLLFWLLSQIATWLDQTSLAEQSAGLIRLLLQTLRAQPEWIVALLGGIWLGALSHTLADESLSRWKRWRRKKRKRPVQKRQRR